MSQVRIVPLDTNRHKYYLALGADYVAVRSSGTTEDLPGQKSLSRTLGNKQIKHLAKLAAKVEAGLEGPQDIEWAIRGAETFFLQSRPVTTIAKEKSWPDRQVWSNMAAQEVLPDVVTPAINKYDFTDDSGSEPGLREIIEVEKTMTAEDLTDLVTWKMPIRAWISGDWPSR